MRGLRKIFDGPYAILDATYDNSSSISDTDTDDEVANVDRLEEPDTIERNIKMDIEMDMTNFNSQRKNLGSIKYTSGSSDEFDYYDTSDDTDTNTATDNEEEEEIRARKLRKQEVYFFITVIIICLIILFGRCDDFCYVLILVLIFLFVDKESDTVTVSEEEMRARAILHNDKGADKEVKPTFNLNSRQKTINKPLNNLSETYEEYNIADSGEVDLNMNKIDSMFDNLTKKPLTNFDIATRDEKSHDPKFVDKYKNRELQPILIIKRTPGKIFLKMEEIFKEISKQKVSLNVAALNKKIYFGVENEPLKKDVLEKSETSKRPMIEKDSLSETSNESNDFTCFNFDPTDDDFKDIDNYIEYLLAKEKEFKLKSQNEEEKVASSIEDLLKTLDTEGDDKIDVLHNWVDNLNHHEKISVDMDKVDSKELIKKCETFSTIIGTTENVAQTSAVKKSKYVDMDALDKVDIIKKMLQTFETDTPQDLII